MHWYFEVESEVLLAGSETQISGQITAKAAPPKAQKRQTPLRLTAREIELLEFVLDQKFANLEMLYLRFYEAQNSKSNRYALHRISLMKRYGFLRAQRVHTEAGNFYLTTPLSQATLSQLKPDKTISEPIERINLSTFEHDKRVAMCRAVREKRGEVTGWLSERRLKQDGIRHNGYRLSREYMPDAIYTATAGHKVAFELELAPKTRERYAKKISRFLEVMKSPDSAFSRTLFVACSDSVYQMLLSCTRPYPEHFKVLRYEEIVTPKPKKDATDV